MKTKEDIVGALKSELERLQKELAEMRKFHEAAWREYGSELCAGEMFDKDRKLVERIRRINGFLEGYQHNLSPELFQRGIHVMQLNKQAAETQKKEIDERIKSIDSDIALWKEMAGIAGVDITEKQTTP